MRPRWPGEHAAHALRADPEQVLGIRVVGGDAVAVEVVVHVLDLLVAGEEHEPAGAARGGEVVVDVDLARFRRDVGGHADLLAGDARHRVPSSRCDSLGARGRRGERSPADGRVQG